MKLSIDTLKKIEEKIGRFTIHPAVSLYGENGYGKKECLVFKFNYWEGEKIDIDRLSLLLPYGWTLEMDMFQDDEGVCHYSYYAIFN